MSGVDGDVASTEAGVFTGIENVEFENIVVMFHVEFEKFEEFVEFDKFVEFDTLVEFEMFDELDMFDELVEFDILPIATV
jgi:hypothetical protein